jgi:phosphomannomutase/phosphoglucomutase
MTHLPREIFKAYDIRGVVGRTLTRDIVRAVGQALG